MAGKGGLEIEVRYRVNNLSKIESRLVELGGKKIGSGRLVDHWFVPREIMTQEQQLEWFDKNRGCAVRIRDEYKSESKKPVYILEAKRMDEKMNHNNLIESKVIIDSYETGKEFLQLLDRKEFLTIDKRRILYKIRNFEVALDNVTGFGQGVEIEIKNVRDQDQAMAEISEFAGELGLGEANRLEKSMTVEAMKHLARF